MIPGSTSGISFSRILSRQASHQDATQHTDAQQAEIQQAAEDSSPGAEVQKFVQSTDEMSAALAQFRNRRDYEKNPVIYLTVLNACWRMRLYRRRSKY